MRKYIVINIPDTGETIYINPKTGEVEDLKGKILWTITDEEYKNKLLIAKKEKLRRNAYKGSFFWFKHSLNAKIFNNFSSSEVFRLMFVSTHLKYDRNFLKRKGDFIYKKDLKEKLNLDRRIFNKF